MPTTIAIPRIIWIFLLLIGALIAFLVAAHNDSPGYWAAYKDHFSQAKYVDLTHTIAPDIPVWSGFRQSTFAPAQNPATNQSYTYERDGFEATQYNLATDQLGTQLDPPAHWDPYFPAIDELPASYALRPLVVISIHEKVKHDPGYHLQVQDILDWEHAHSLRIPSGSVVFVRSDWSRRWPDRVLSHEKVFPGVSLEAIKFLHLNRSILLHGHEPLDTDTTPTLEGEEWILRHGFAQAEGEGVANLDKVPEAGALVTIGFAKFQGGTGGYARFVAICPAGWEFGVEARDDAPMGRMKTPLRWVGGVRRRE